MTWNQPICESCWIEQNSARDAEGVLAIRKPVTLLALDIERCSYCNGPTFVGIYVRDDPATVPYPQDGERLFKHPRQEA